MRRQYEIVEQLDIYIKSHKQCSFKFGIISDKKTHPRLISNKPSGEHLIPWTRTKHLGLYFFLPQLRYDKTAKIVLQPAARVQYRG